MKSVLKNWWLQLVLFFGALVDFGMDFLPIVLKEVNLDPKYATVIRIILIGFAIYKSKVAEPSIEKK